MLQSYIRRNPYFIGILSAIPVKYNIQHDITLSQSLFYWNPFCNRKIGNLNKLLFKVAILILLESFLQ